MLIFNTIDKKFFIVGTVSNVANSVENELIRLIRAFKETHVTGIYLVESDSTDSTVIQLTQLKSKIKNFDFISLGNLKETIPDRLDRIRYCRNEYVKYLKKNNFLDGDIYVVVADLDGMNNAISEAGVLSCFQRIDWDVVSANQTFGYYDILALRKRGWQETDWTEDFNSKKISLLIPNRSNIWIIRTILKYWHLDRLKHRLLFSKMKRIKVSSEWILVDSAFGGLAIYKSEIFNYYDYSKEFETNETDHVSLNRKLVRDGKKIYINPNLINSHINEYNLSRVFIFRLLRNILWSNKTLYGIFKKYLKRPLDKLVYKP